MDFLWRIGNAVSYVWDSGSTFLILYGWYLFGLIVLYGAFRHRIWAEYIKWRRRRDEYEYSAKFHKDSDLARSRMESLIMARERLQREHDAKTAEAERKRLEREEKKKSELAALLEQGGSNGVHRFGSKSGSSLRADYMPLMGDTGSGGYKPPKKSCCKKGGGCG